MKHKKNGNFLFNINYSRKLVGWIFRKIHFVINSKGNPKNIRDGDGLCHPLR